MWCCLGVAPGPLLFCSFPSMHFSGWEDNDHVRWQVTSRWPALVYVVLSPSFAIVSESCLTCRITFSAPLSKISWQSFVATYLKILFNLQFRSSRMWLLLFYTLTQASFYFTQTYFAWAFAVGQDTPISSSKEENWKTTESYKSKLFLWVLCSGKISL